MTTTFNLFYRYTLKEMEFALSKNDISRFNRKLNELALWENLREEDEEKAEAFVKRIVWEKYRKYGLEVL